jgi:hypothetical protein
MDNPPEWGKRNSRLIDLAAPESQRNLPTAHSGSIDHLASSSEIPAVIGSKTIDVWLAPVIETCARSGQEELARQVCSAELSKQPQHLGELLGALQAEKIWQLPFPMGVFGTLRAGCRNHALMQTRPVAKQQRGFLPHFAARAIGLHYRTGACAPFEIYGYSASDWQAMILPVDELEEFRPGMVDPDGYHRTLAWVYLLPEQFDDPIYDVALLPEERDLRIAARLWSTYERVPCWIYSGIAQNRAAAAQRESPIIWDGVTVR